MQAVRLATAMQARHESAAKKTAKSPFENYGCVMRRMSRLAMATSIMA